MSTITEPRGNASTRPTEDEIQASADFVLAAGKGAGDVAPPATDEVEAAAASVLQFKSG